MDQKKAWHKESNIFILTDDTIRSIVFIQEAHKKADNNFNDFVAQLYEQEFKTQEKAKYEHIRQAKEKAIEEQRVNQENQLRIEAEQRAEADRVARANIEEAKQREAERQKKIDMENEAKRDIYQSNSNGSIGTDWSNVSSESAANYMASKTSVSASKWLDVIYKESSGNPYALNSLSCYGLLQINQSVHGQVSNLSPQEYLDKAINIYQSSGGTAWDTW